MDICTYALHVCVTFIIQEMKTFGAVYLKTFGFDLILDAPNRKAEESTVVKEATGLNTEKMHHQQWNKSKSKIPLGIS